MVKISENTLFTKSAQKMFFSFFHFWGGPDPTVEFSTLFFYFVLRINFIVFANFNSFFHFFIPNILLLCSYCQKMPNIVQYRSGNIYLQISSPFKFLL